MKDNMEIKEAIRRIKDHFRVHDDGMPTPYLDKAVSIAIKALEKQIPKEPYYSGDGYWNGELVYDTWTCPNCSKSYEVDYDDYDYCPKCGQKIKREE